ncbi:MAG: hypothetical protein ABI378_10570 [Chitinophagaceae bacterium]
MSRILKYTLIADGSSDKVLLDIIKWSLDNLYPKLSNNGVHADFRNLLKPPENGDVKARILKAIKYYPCDILFYHRDAEDNSATIIEERKSEVLNNADNKQPIVCIVPVVMTESWLMFDELAIKRASGNRNYKMGLDLPPINRIESIKDPKDRLYKLLREISGIKKRNLSKFNPGRMVHLIAEYIDDFSELRGLSSFKVFEKDLKIAVENYIAHKPND